MIFSTSLVLAGMCVCCLYCWLASSGDSELGRVSSVPRWVSLEVATLRAILKIYNKLVSPAFLYGSEKWTLTALQRRRIKRHNWSYWDLQQATPFMTTNKWIHMPRTTDYRHIRQDRWIQTELAFTLAKNATKPNPFEIIPLQTTRKENNWKTEEALALAAVTLEMEQIKGSNPWCLWWWWLLTCSFFMFCATW